jgi:hypothetical protein
MNEKSEIRYPSLWSKSRWKDPALNKAPNAEIFQRMSNLEAIVTALLVRHTNNLATIIDEYSFIFRMAVD